METVQPDKKKAKKMWGKLKKFLIKKDKFEPKQQIFTSVLNKKTENGFNIYEFANGKHIKIPEGKKEFTFQEFKENNKDQVDSTGLLLWPTEEILTQYCLERLDQFEGKKICELGCGFSALITQTLALSLNECEIHVSDGKQECVDEVKEIITTQEDLKTKTSMFYGSEELVSNEGKNSIHINHLVWSLDFKGGQDFDQILISECLFFRNYHKQLLHVIKQLLSPKGSCIIAGPPRKGANKEFLKVCEEDGSLGFEFIKPGEAIQGKIDEVKGKEGYDADLHLTEFIELKYK